MRGVGLCLVRLAIALPALALPTLVRNPPGSQCAPSGFYSISPELVTWPTPISEEARGCTSSSLRAPESGFGGVEWRGGRTSPRKLCSRLPRLRGGGEVDPAEACHRELCTSHATSLGSFERWAAKRSLAHPNDSQPSAVQIH